MFVELEFIVDIINFGKSYIKLSSCNDGANVLHLRSLLDFDLDSNLFLHLPAGLRMKLLK